MPVKPSQKQVINWYQAMGAEDFAIEEPTVASSDQELVKDSTIKASKMLGQAQTESRSLADKASSLDELKNMVMNFDGCALKKFAKNTVFGEGNPSSKIMLIGEAPGASEDEQGRPFCGESGKLLDAMMASIGLSRESNIYITNSVFWRPPANRTPTREEVEMCKPFVEKHIALLKPKLVIMVGSTALTTLIGAHLKVSNIRQEYYNYTNSYLSEPIKVTAIFHPAYLLRQPSQKKTSWYDLLAIKDFLIA